MSRGSLQLHLSNLASMTHLCVFLSPTASATLLCADSSDKIAAFKAFAIGSCKYIINTHNRLVYTPFRNIAAASASKASFIFDTKVLFFFGIGKQKLVLFTT